jgi:hypothetical protein
MKKCQFSGNSDGDRPDHPLLILCGAPSASLFIVMEIRVVIHKSSLYFVSDDKLVNDPPQVLRLLICSALSCPSIQMKLDDQKNHHFFD